MRCLLALLTAIAALVILPIPASADDAVCRDDPLEGLEQGRWDVLSPCETIAGEVVQADFPSSGGAYWIVLSHDGRETWAKFYPQYPLPAPRLHQVVSITGALVYDKAWGFREIVPVWRSQIVKNDPRVQGDLIMIVIVRRAGDIVRYNVVAANLSGVTMDAAYIALAKPFGGLWEWAGSIKHKTVVDLHYEVPFVAGVDYTGSAFAHWLQPQDGTMTATAPLVEK